MTSYEIYEPSGHILRIKEKIKNKGVKLNPPIPWEELEAFEKKHGIILPPEYREFILEAGNGGEGPAGHGLVRLGEAPDSMSNIGIEVWTRLEDIRKEFPFTEAWDWEPEDWEKQGFEEIDYKQIEYGNIALGGDWWNVTWHLIVTGPSRGQVWAFHEEGVMPLEGKPDFLKWYEAWLDEKAHRV